MEASFKRKTSCVLRPSVNLFILRIIMVHIKPCTSVLCFSLFFVLVLLFAFPSLLATAQTVRQDGTLKTGSSGLPIPRFVSLRSDEVNVRKGPGKDYQVAWIYRKIGLPVEITAESENWRRVRDSEGAQGWVFHRLLSGRRTVTVMPWLKDDAEKKRSNIPLYQSAEVDQDRVSAYVEAGILGRVIRCNKEWCKISISNHNGWIQQDKLWGVYQNEAVN